MRSLIYRVHIWLGLIVAIPVLAWASSGLLYAWPNTVEGGRVETIDATRVRVSPSDALARAGEFAGKKLPTTALTLLMRDGRPVYQAIGQVPLLIIVAALACLSAASGFYLNLTLWFGKLLGRR